MIGVGVEGGREGGREGERKSSADQDRVLCAGLDRVDSGVVMLTCSPSIQSNATDSTVLFTLVTNKVSSFSSISR